jgi:hypothetical protein
MKTDIHRLIILSSAVLDGVIRLDPWVQRPRASSYSTRA